MFPLGRRSDRIVRQAHPSAEFTSGMRCVSSCAEGPRKDVRVRGSVKNAVTMMRAITGSTKMLPSGPVAPPLTQGAPTGCVDSRRCALMLPLSATPKRKDCAQSHAACRPMAHHSEPVRHRLKANTSPAQPAQSRPMRDSPGLKPWVRPKPKEMRMAALQKPMASVCWLPGES